HHASRARAWTNGLGEPLTAVDSMRHFQANGFAVSNTSQACDPTKTPDDTALLCSPATYVTPNADQTYIFADDLHSTTRLHALFAQFIEQQIARSGLGH
ncbi:lipase, partial [Paraburkholderia sp. WS6]|nr:lipase [Paraburkholderia madseniana]MDN7151720.1 lipase [Paraburkholderia sp. WS6]MDQ6410600.1 lipase [Paraburkholderia madseniana]